MFFGIGVPPFAAESGSGIMQQVNITRIGREEHVNLFGCVQRPAHRVSRHSVVRRLAGARYQLDIAALQAGIVDNG